MTSFMIALLAGFAGSFHCLGMCGGFACGLNQGHAADASTMVVRTLLYNAGRLATYAFIGALAGAFGAAIIDGHGAMSQASHLDHGRAVNHSMTMVLAGEIGVAQRVLAAMAGLLMLLMGLELLGLRRHGRRSWAVFGGTTLAGTLTALLRSPSPAAPLALGVANGFLPCPLVLAFTATAAATGGVGPAVLTMTAFGLGTFPAMFFMGAVGAMMSPRLRLWGVRVAGAFVILIGVLTVARGLMPGFVGTGHAIGII